jgi:type IV pilus assembly protein PilB
MSRRARIGELLSRMVPLSGHDVEEILQEQSANRRRFGDIALSWGLCRPEHVWDAWVQQSADGTEAVDLEKIGVDAQAAAMLPGDVARQFGVIPVRAASDAVLVATSDTAPEHAAEPLAQHLHRRIKFVRASQEQLQRMIEMYYPTPTGLAG